MDEIIKWVTGLADWVKIVCGMIISLATVATIFKKQIKNFVDNVKSILKHKETIDSLQQGQKTLSDKQDAMNVMLTNISNEFKPNGGFSMNDRIASIQKDVKVLVIEQRFIADDDDRLVFWIDLNGNCYHANETFLHSTGLDLAETKGRGWINTIAYEDSKRVRDDIDLAAKEQRAFKGEFKMILHGITVKVECIAKPIPPDNKLVGFKVVVTPRN